MSNAAPIPRFSGHGAQSVSWLEVAEFRLRELVDVQGCRPPRELEAMLAGPVDELHALLRARLRPALLTGRPGRCELPWLGCPRHGDLLGYRGHGWGCTVSGCGFTLSDVFARLRHCRRRAVAVLGEVDGSHTLAVCSGHLVSEWQLGDCGLPFTVRRIGTDGLAA
ncbi:hypothetical protein IU500_33910 [Nocardia terpenica]|uniref:hypothetical protein n=1 Tax=Nocardia terpenica TaxID=455432 RepID=UPI0018959D80|nr:hypothetical protein [Nocardia terpenica]MBF6066061.1 hypothetical protein [Nocardia terpenica]MBF6109012.1 hypothetical protein [Nocardia terpenica]MBF6116305.1 hypothetical protein [Nocardia terpenica]MBF6123306.1 hypothetical protein [Nocardia terpenica]MBF6156511.1 hypothetical protein [Nocardia terpenica]